jgi:formylglycine-generating enzyme required for sulfatase activity
MADVAVPAAGAAERFAEHVEPLLRTVPAGSFVMGTDPAAARHFCGETPRHEVVLSEFRIARVPVTNRLYALFDPRRAELPRDDLDKPVVDVSWFDATRFTRWMGCRLPTEAEWERACGAGAAGEWCCEREADLPRHAWFSETSQGELHEVGRLEPNALGLFDMHGNVWEWVVDAYDAGFYARSPRRDPVLDPAPDSGADRVCRGGSLHSLSEMCRTRYRLHDPPELWAFDLGFRLAAGPATEEAP